MNVTLRISDELAQRLGADGADLGRRALEALVLEAFRAGRLSKADLRHALGFEVIYELDGFLKAHGVFEEYTLEELDTLSGQSAPAHH